MVRDLTCSLVLLLVAAGYYALASGLGRSALDDEVGPAGLPLIYASSLGLLALALAGKALLQPLVQATEIVASTEAEPALSLIVIRAAGLCAIGIGYVFIVPLAGYFPTMALVIAAVALYQHESPSLRLALIATGGAAIFWLLFVQVLGIPMPGGFAS